MPVIKLGKRRRVILPPEVCQEASVKEGEYLDVGVRDGTIIMKPHVLVDKERVETIQKDLASFWREKAKEMPTVKLSKEGERMVAEALEDIEKGRFKVFDNVEDLIRDLKSS